MKTTQILVLLIASTFFFGFSDGCNGGGAEQKDREVVDKQQDHYGKVQPVHFYDHSIPRDIVIQIYDIVTTESRSTYTVIETITGQIKFYGPSIGYGIPADVQLTNPLKPAYENISSPVIEQAEPNGLFSSKNTDGTWVCFVDKNGDVAPIYTEHKVTTYPFAVVRQADGSWVRAENSKSSIKLKMDGINVLPAEKK